MNITMLSIVLIGITITSVSLFIYIRSIQFNNKRNVTINKPKINISIVQNVQGNKLK